MPAPIATVIVPGRDIAAFAPAALYSLRAQTEPRWRALLVDDGSEDATGRIFDAAAAGDSRFVVVHHDRPKGLGAARNTALPLVDTPFVGFLDGDDEFAPTALARLTETLTETGSDFVAAAYVRSRWDGNAYATGRIQPWVAAATDPARLGTTIFAHPAASANIVAWSKLSRTDFWRHRRFPESVAYEDQMVAQQMYVAARAFDVIPDPVVRWRVRADGSSLTQSKDRLPVLRDYLTALRGGIAVLHEAGASAAVTARLGLILSMDLPPIQEIADTHPDPAYAAEVRAFLASLQSLPEFVDARADPTLAAALRW
ncbi:glycosyltransferase family 2 protein [uncultured Microbacterium sp.]|uniref:glycosyltransferase family 2 protein n=1 Tax=uncultured Microbacterium sp. TaxID=191216 RepID=UPI0025CDF211|nr:glycosyltransferase family 2 protein [uncultured Microbacterium sp.]